MIRSSRLSGPRLPATACAILVHVAVAAVALWASGTPKAAPEPPKAIKIKIAPPAPDIARPQQDTPPPPKPEPKPEPKKTETPRPPKPEPTPAPAPQSLPELESTAEANTSSRQVAAPPPAPPSPAVDSPTDKARKADYYARLLGWLDQHKDYPREARLRREQGVAQLYFRMSRDGRVLSYRLDDSSGHQALDDAVIRMIERANPLPPFPPEIKDAELELVVPVEFFLNRGKRRG